VEPVKRSAVPPPKTEAPSSPDEGTQLPGAPPSSPSNEAAKSDTPADPDTNRISAEDQRIKDGAQKLADRFATTADRAAHNALVDDREIAKQLDWLKKHRRPVYVEIIEPALKESWARTGAKPP
jgi:hypothetical protein